MQKTQQNKIEYTGMEIEVRANHKGKALYAGRRFHKGEAITRLGGELHKKPKKTTIQVDENTHIDGFWGNANHSCEPNTYINFEDFTIRALKEINVGEELSWNYCTTDWDFSSPFKCSCGSKKCLGDVRGFKHLSPEQKEALRPYSSPFLSGKI